VRTGTIISASGHVGLILWVLLGDWLFTAHEPVEIETTTVETVSPEEFAALTAGDQPAAPTTEVETPTPPPVEEQPPTPEPAPQPQPEVPPAVLPEPRRDPEPVPEDLPEPDPVPEPTPEPEPAPTEPEPVVPGPVTDAPVSPDVQPEIVLDSVAPVNPDVRPKPKPSQVVSPEVVDAPEEASDDATTPTPAVSEEVVPEEPPVEEPPEEVAPEDTGETNITEANQDDVASTLAPTSSGRPPRRPERATPAPQPEETTEQPTTETAAETTTEEPATETPATDPGTEEPAEDPLADILADVQEAGTRTGLSGSSMSFGETDNLRSAIRKCWNVGNLSTAATRVKVTIWVDMSPDGKPIPASIKLKSFTDGDDAAATQAFEAARRAILRCGRQGFPVPMDKYDAWRELELNFDGSQALIQ
jgi:hypothetical protein